MRVVAGRLGGRRLSAPPGRTTRPTADRVREALFSILGDITGLRVLDLFAGSGALGIEALSRGASEAVFVDSSHRAVATVRANLRDLALEAAVHQRDALAFLRRPGEGPRFHLVFLDPPYDWAGRLADPLAERLPAILTDDARIVTESDKRRPLLIPFPLVRERIYGDTRIAVHRPGSG
ncbi:MAG TPA: 16S rRNA (guanine(966)-N(2))-methyltransferase RsmD [Thermoleophilaceae bacterium]|nr:16S rRNA (guanine(966)-N(2))-methyltransferase RsmD [Thermoleophilaceae bacterium]